MFFWEAQVLGTDLYHIAFWFVIYSILGWVAESIYMSICNRKLTNRGFAKGPFCPIYGVGLVGAYFIFRPISGNYALLFICGAIVATVFEYLVGELMIRFLGDLWWDYNEKPFNYRGIICLESTLGWGLYTVLLFAFVHNGVMNLSNQVNPRFGRYFCSVTALIYMLDFTVQLMRVLNIQAEERFRSKVSKVKETCEKLKARFY